MVRDYELMYIVRPDLDDDALSAAMQSVETVVQGQGGEVVRTTPWGKRRLAYEIDRMRDGNYVLLHVRLDGARVKEVERLLHISDSVVRHLVTLWVDTRGKEGEDGETAAAGDGQVRERAVRAPRDEVEAVATEANGVADAPAAGTGGDEDEEGDDDEEDDGDEAAVTEVVDSDDAEEAEEDE